MVPTVNAPPPAPPTPAPGRPAAPPPGQGGLFRSDDSGANWARVKTGIVYDLVMDPSNPVTLYAGVQGDGVYKTTTGGAGGDSAWTKLTGLPNGGFTQITLALCKNLPTTIYAGLSGSPFRVFRSTDGAAFSLRFKAATSIYNPWMGVDPSDPSIVYVLSQQFLRSTDGGASFAPPIGDTHECQKFALHPIAPGVIYLGRDNGLFRSPDHGSTWAQIGAGIANIEFYDGALAATDSSLMIGGAQDNGTSKYDGASTQHRLESDSGWGWWIGRHRSNERAGTLRDEPVRGQHSTLHQWRRHQRLQFQSLLRRAPNR